MSTILETAAGSSPKNATGAWGPLLIGAAGVAVTGAWVLFLFFVVPALMK
jgi:hypothetical protein